MAKHEDDVAVSLLGMPDDALSNVLERCCGDTLLALAQTCTRLRRLVDEDSTLWRATCVRSGWKFTWWHPSDDRDRLGTPSAWAPPGTRAPAAASTATASCWKAAWLRRRALDAPVNRLMVVNKGWTSLVDPSQRPADATRPPRRQTAVRTLPAFCPFGKRVAYVEEGWTSEATHFQEPPVAIVVAAVEPGRNALLPVLRFVTHATPFYLHWCPDGQHVSYLVPDAHQQGIALNVVPLSAFSSIGAAYSSEPLARRTGPQVPAHPLGGGASSSSAAASMSRWRVATGMPLFYTFNPVRAHQVIIHSGAASQRVLDYGAQLDGGSSTTTRLPIWFTPARAWAASTAEGLSDGTAAALTNDFLDQVQFFQAPAYTHNGTHTLSVAMDLSGQGARHGVLLTCVPIPEAGAAPQHRCISAWSIQLARVQAGKNSSRFAVSPDGVWLVCTHMAQTLRLIALQAALERDGEETACTCTQRVPLTEDDIRPRIIDVSAVNVAAFQWSPCSRYLLILTDALPPFGAGQWSRPWRRWNVHCVVTGRTWHAPAPVLLTGVLEDIFLPFHEQYFRSAACTLWAPDSTGFCYAALDEQDGTDAAFVQELPDAAAWGCADAPIQATPPTRIAAGDMVLWSPL
jgi:hypothetical protein